MPWIPFFFQECADLDHIFFYLGFMYYTPLKTSRKNSLLKWNLKVCIIFVHDISLFWISDIA